ncbi:MAG: hypothetical protein ACRD2L_02725 [Terriglobia bacterium]
MVRQPSIILEKRKEGADEAKNEKKIRDVDAKIQKLKNAISVLETKKRSLQRGTGA